MNILICDDDRSTLNYLKSIISEHYGKLHQISTFSNAEELLGFNGEADLLLSDVKLNDKNGIEVCRDLLHGFDFSKFVTGTDLDRARTISGAVNFLIAPNMEERKETFQKESLALHQALSLCSSMVKEHDRIEAALMESVRVLIGRLTNTGIGKKISLPEMNARINELLKQSIKSDGVINLFSDVKEEFSLFDPKFLEEIAKMKEKILQLKF